MLNEGLQPFVEFKLKQELSGVSASRSRLFT